MKFYHLDSKCYSRKEMLKPQKVNYESLPYTERETARIRLMSTVEECINALSVKTVILALIGEHLICNKTIIQTGEKVDMHIYEVEVNEQDERFVTTKEIEAECLNYLVRTTKENWYKGELKPVKVYKLTVHQLTPKTNLHCVRVRDFLKEERFGKRIEFDDSIQFTTYEDIDYTLTEVE